MSEQQKETIMQNIDKLPPEKKAYVTGYIDGMISADEMNKAKESEKPCTTDS